MPYQNAKHKHITSLPEFWVLVTGKGENGEVGYQWGVGSPHRWMLGQMYEKPLLIAHRGIPFAIYDYLPLEKNSTYIIMLDAIINFEDLGYSE